MLVVASASKPRCASRRAVPASHGFGMMNAPSRSWSARKARAFSACVAIVAVGVIRGPLSGTAPSGACTGGLRAFLAHGGEDGGRRQLGVVRGRRPVGDRDA